MAIKTIISPLQFWLLKTGRCVGCSMPLSKGKRQDKGNEGKVICKCGRIYIFSQKTKSYRRALLNEV